MDILDSIPRVEAVAAFVESHGFAARLTAGRIEALIPWSRRLPDGTYDGGAEWTDCGSTMSAARVALGY